MLKSPIIYIDLFELISLSNLSSKYTSKCLGELCCLYMTSQMMLLFCGTKLDFDPKWLEVYVRYFFNNSIFQIIIHVQANTFRG